MKWLTAVLVVLSSTSFAQPEPPAIPPGEDQIEHLTTGTRAPYEGMLLSIDTALRWTNALRWWPETFQLRVRHLEQELAMHQQSWERQRQIVEEGHQHELELLLTRVTELSAEVNALRDPPFRKTRAFGFLAGAVVCVLVVVATGVAALAL